MNRNVLLWAGSLLSFVLFLLTLLKDVLPSGMPSKIIVGLGILVLLALWLFSLSPTMLLFGQKRPVFDIPVIIGVLGCASAGIFAVMETGASRFEGPSAVFGILLLTGAGFGMSSSMIAQRESLLASLGFGGRASAIRVFLIAFLLCAMSILFVRPILLFFSDVSRFFLSAFFLLLTTLFFAGLGILGKPFFQFSRALHQRGIFIRGLFLKRSTIFLGLSLLLLAPFAIDTLFWSIPKSSSLLGSATLSGEWLLVILYVVAIAGSLFLSLLPLWIWVVLCRLRKTSDDQHLPSWSPVAMAFSYAIIMAAFMVPGVGVQRWILSPGYLDQFSPGLVLLSSLSIFSIVFLISSLSEMSRRILLGGPFLFAIIFLGAYSYARFVTVFAELMAIFSFPQLFPIAMPSLLFLSGISLAFSVLGYFGFLYEIWRD